MNFSSETLTRIFIDADAFVSLMNQEGSNHQRAVELQMFIDVQNIQAWTSNFSVNEAITVISQEVGLKQAVAFGKKLFAGGIHLIDVNRRQEEQGLERFARQTSKNSRFTDMVNMVLMDELKIDTIFSFDNHYPKNGYKLLTP